MSEGHTHDERRNCPQTDFRGAHGVIMQVEASKLLPWLMLIAVLSGVALGLSVVTLCVQATAYRELERETRLAQLKIDEFRMALMAAKIDPNPHLEGESK